MQVDERVHRLERAHLGLVRFRGGREQQAALADEGFPAADWPARRLPEQVVGGYG